MRFLRLRAESSRTRIETQTRQGGRAAGKVSERNPAEQGLKPPISHLLRSATLVSERNPAEQGLKHDVLHIAAAVALVSERNPAEQGLKPTGDAK